MTGLKRMLYIVAIALAVPAIAQEAKLKPSVGDDCLDTDYTCQPSSITEQQYDKMPLSVTLGRDLPALIELEPFDPEDALIRRFMLNTRGVMGREVPIPDSSEYFCTLSHATNTTLQYFPASGLWNFVIAFDPEAELLAGGLATCLNIAQVYDLKGGRLND